MRKTLHKIIEGQVLFLLMFLWAISLNAQSDSAFYKGYAFSCKYHFTSGMLNGHYVSYYINGVKKSEGNFQYNTRIGKWSVWDSAGNLRTQREYVNPYEYKRMYPKIPAEGPALLLSSPVYRLHRDSNGAWNRFYLDAITIRYRQRDFKCFYTSQNQLFFNCQMLFDALYQAAVSDKVEVGGKDEINTSGKLDITTIDTSKYTLAGFRIKSDWYFDDIRMEGDPRILFITALATAKNNPKDTVDLFSIYYRDVQEILAKKKVLNTTLSPYIQNLDDVFFFCSFGFEKYAEATPTDTHLQYTCTPENGLSNGLLEEVETEHNLWIYFNK